VSLLQRKKRISVNTILTAWICTEGRSDACNDSVDGLDQSAINLHICHISKGPHFIIPVGRTSELQYTVRVIVPERLIHQGANEIRPARCAKGFHFIWFVGQVKKATKKTKRGVGSEGPLLEVCRGHWDCGH